MRKTTINNPEVLLQLQHTSMPQFSLPISAWSAWAPGLDDRQAWCEWAIGKRQGAHDGNPELPFVEPMLRRRLGRLARMAIHAAHHSLGERPSASIVFASRHGDLVKTLGMLEDLAEGEMPSPTAFSLSVNNASMGVFSILRQLHGQSTAIAASSESFGYGLLEAVTRLQSCPSEPVLYVYADDDLPALYAAAGNEKPWGFFPHAIALLLDAEAPVCLSMELEPCSASENDAGSQTFAFMQVLCGANEAASWRDHQHWTWSRLQ